DYLGGVLGLLREHHAGKVHLCSIAREGFDSFERQLRTAEAAIAGVEIFIAVGCHVRLGHHAALGVGSGGGGDVHALTDTLGYAAHFFTSGDAVGRNEINVGEENIAREVSALQQQPGSDPATPSRPTSD